jgi:hypothetical protein
MQAGLREMKRLAQQAKRWSHDSDIDYALARIIQKADELLK